MEMIKNFLGRIRSGDGPLPQIELRWLGGMKTILGRLTFYRGTLTFLMIIPVAYNSTPTLQSWFPTVYAFGLFMALLLGLAAIIEYSVIFPSQLLFNKSQSAKNGRDPIYAKVEELEKQNERLLRKLDEVED